MKFLGRDGKESVQPPPSGDLSRQSPPLREDVESLLNASLKEIGDKIARISSSIESVQKEREEFEGKLQAMEEKMRKLSSLTEVVSSAYNPFVGGEPPTEASRGQATEGVVVVPSPRPRPPSSAEEKAAALSRGPPPRSFESPAGSFPLPAPLEETSARLSTIPSSFEANLLVLRWCHALLRSTSREGLDELLTYYEEIGWISEEVHRKLRSFAEGIQSPSSPERDWRADVELHEHSLLVIEKLRSLTPPDEL